MEIAAWLRQLGLERFEQAFLENDIDLDLLGDLGEDDLKEIGISSLGARRKILKACEGLADSPMSFKSSPNDPPKTGEGDRVQAERRQLSVMFVDLVGSTNLSTRLDPEDMSDLLQLYQRTVSEELVRSDGHVAKLMGDGVLAYFGWPQAHEDDAERAVRAGLHIVEAVSKLMKTSNPLACRVGIATGLVVIGDLVESGTTWEEAVVGETPNLAARLQAAAEPNTVVIGPRTRQFVGGLFQTNDLGLKSFKGFENKVRVWQVESERTGESRFEARHSGKDIVMVGREHELALLEERWARTRNGEGQIVLLSGEAGLGKSTLVRALLEAISDEPHVRIRYQCSPHHASSPFYPITQRLERVAGFEQVDSEIVRLDKLESVLVPPPGTSPDALSLIASLLSIEMDDRRQPLDFDARQHKQRTLEVLIEQIEELEKQSPVLVICEDAHWIDPSTGEMLSMLAERLAKLSVYLLITFRPDSRYSLGQHTHATHLSLNRLAKNQAIAMIEWVAGKKTLPQTIIAQILERADGVPLFVEELTRSVLVADILEEGRDSLLPKGPLSTLAVPDTLQASLMARLDRLADVKEIVQAASVVGREFDKNILAVVTNWTSGRLEDALERMQASEIVYRRGKAFVFRHALFQETAYDSLLRTKRQRLHEMVAEFLERRALGTTPPEILAHHLEAAGITDRACMLWLEAGINAKQRWANIEARTHFQRCISSAEGIVAPSKESLQAHIDGLLMLGDLEGLAENLERANACYEQALQIASDELSAHTIRNKMHRMRFATRDGARIAFYEHGTGNHTLLFVSPLLYGIAIFQPILERLCQDFHIVTIDCRGTGASDPLTRPFTLDQHVDDVIAVIEMLDRKPVIGVGISRGGELLFKLTHKRPDLIERLIPVGCPLAIAGHDRATAFAATFLEVRKQAYQQNDIEMLIRNQIGHIFTEPGTEEIRQGAIRHRSKLADDTVLSFHDPDSSVGVSSILSQITVPVMVTHGREDQIISFAAAEHLTNCLPNAELRAFEGKGHMPIFTATEQFCSLVREFVNRES